MIPSFLVVGLVALSIPVPVEPEPILLFAEEAWYQKQAGPEQEFVGILTRFEPTLPGGGRFNPYRLLLVGDRKEMHELHAGTKPDTLRPFVGKKVKLLGKVVQPNPSTPGREIWPARLFVMEDEKTPPKPRRIPLLGEHRLYPQEPGKESIREGVLRKEEKGGYVLELEKTRVELTLYPDTGDPLAPFLDRQVRIAGKEIVGLVGRREFRHTIPGWLELVDTTPLTVDRLALRSQANLLWDCLGSEEQRLRDLTKQLNTDGVDAPVAQELRLRITEATRHSAEIKAKIAELDRQLDQPGPGATRLQLEQLLLQEKQALSASLNRFKEIQRILANITEVTPTEFIQARREELKVKQEVEKAAQRVRELEEQIARVTSSGP